MRGLCWERLSVEGRVQTQRAFICLRYKRSQTRSRQSFNGYAAIGE